MSKVSQNTEKIREFIFSKLSEHPGDIVNIVSKTFGISRQAVSRHMQNLELEELIETSGAGRNKRYFLKELFLAVFPKEMSAELEEGELWRIDIKPVLESFKIRENVRNICQHGFTEMVNNVIDHSEATEFFYSLHINSVRVLIMVGDNGIGVFKKIKRHFKLDDPRQAMLELSKGKLTTDPENHSGEGIFFTSRMFEHFGLDANECLFGNMENREQFLIEDRNKIRKGTFVHMSIGQNSKRTSKEVFLEFAGEENDYAFSKTHVPVKLSQYEGETLISRSQARRLLARFEQFEEVLLDFESVKDIGQAFADEIFRVFANAHPKIKIRYVHVNKDVERMILRALNK